MEGHTGPVKGSPGTGTEGFPKMGVPLNHPFSIGFSLRNHPFGGTPIPGNPLMVIGLG